MWRSEERLEFWLAGGRPSRKSGQSAWLQNLLPRRLAGAVKDLPLEVQAGTATLDDALAIRPAIRDAISILWETAGKPVCFDETSEGPLMREAAADYATTHSVEMLTAAVVRRASIPDANRTRIRQERLAVQAAVRSGNVAISSASIDGLAPLQGRNSEVRDGAGMFLQDPAIRTATQVSELPHKRGSADIELLKADEKKSFLREAEILKHVPSDQGELIAVFRHVPIELISRLRFQAETREIRFIISSEPRRTQTRVHDMAAIRDTANQEIHLVPHRSRYETVFLT